MQRVVQVASLRRRSGPWQDVMADGCAARLATLPSAATLMLPVESERAFAAAPAAPQLTSLPAPGNSLCTIVHYEMS